MGSSIQDLSGFSLDRRLRTDSISEARSLEVFTHQIAYFFASSLATIGSFQGFFSNFHDLLKLRLYTLPGKVWCRLDGVLSDCYVMFSYLGAWVRSRSDG